MTSRQGSNLLPPVCVAQFVWARPDMGKSWLKNSCIIHRRGYHSHMDTTETNHAASFPPSAPAWRRQMVRIIGLAIAVASIGAGYTFHQSLFALFQPPTPAAAPAEKDVVSAVGHTIVVQADSALQNRLKIVPVQSAATEVPALKVTGSIMARLPPGQDLAESRWDFAAPEVASSYSDWIKARADVVFYTGQAVEIKKLAESRVDFWTEEVKRIDKLVAFGAESKSNLAQAKFNLDQAVLQRRKDVYEADKSVENAVRSRGLLERVLLQAGVDPQVVSSGRDGLVLVVADVPERDVAQVRIGQDCRARFFSHRDREFNGQVKSIGPSLSKERRTLRVTFELHDSGKILPPGQSLLPGMFADVGLETRERNVLTVAAEAVLHTGRSDYVLVEMAPGEYAVREIQAGGTVLVELDEKTGKYRAVDVSDTDSLPTTGPKKSSEVCVTILSGLSGTEKVVGAGAILLKPVMVKALANP
jgi:cobalt-zinc-cadmium efflux system membrane fusion protein